MRSRRSHYMVARIICLIFTVLVINSVSAQITYNYAYFSVAQFGDSVELITVEQGQNGSSVRTSVYPLPTGWLMSSPQLGSLVSPNGEWIASHLFSTDNTRLMIQLYNPSSGEARQIIEGYTTTKGKDVVWSPDSRYLALVIGQGTGDLDLFVYSVADNSLTDLTQDTFDQRDIGWWPDSSRVLTFTRPCSINDPCAEQLDIFDVTSVSRAASISLPSLPFMGSSACNPNISLDGQYVSFASNCGLGIPIASDFPNEIYLWNWQIGDLTQITEFASGVTNTLFRATYHHTWLDTHTLLIGVNYQIGEGREQRQFLSYDVNNDSQDILSTTVGTEFVLNPVTDQIALRNDSATSNLGGQVQIEFASFDNLPNPTESLNLDAIAAVDVPSGCQLDWSPDGTTLSYTVYKEGNCQGIISGVTFINPATQAVLRYDFQSANDATDYIIPIGWVAR